MNISKAREHFKSLETSLRCPICGQGGSVDSAGFVCSCRHRFDIASKGYINFAPAHKASHYGNLLFENRRAVFEAGFYSPVLDSLKKTVAESTAPGLLLDAGCGEGYYASSLAGLFPASVGMDIEKEAILMACRRPGNIHWLVGDINKIPLADNSAAVILNILTPASYGEFSRVLAPGGLVIKLLPGAEYLAELRRAVGGRLNQKGYAGGDVAAHFARQMSLCHEEEIHYHLPATPSELENLFKMTPMTAHIALETIDLSGISGVTIHLRLLVGYVSKGVA